MKPSNILLPLKENDVVPSSASQHIQRKNDMKSVDFLNLNHGKTAGPKLLYVLKSNEKNNNNKIF